MPMLPMLKQIQGLLRGASFVSSEEAIQVVKKLLGSGNDKYIFELDHEDKEIKDDKGEFYTNRDNNNESKGIPTSQSFSSNRSTSYQQVPIALAPWGFEALVVPTD